MQPRSKPPKKAPNPFRWFYSSPEVIRLVVMKYVRYPMSLRNLEGLLFERGIDLCHETVRLRWNRFCRKFASEIRRRQVQDMRQYTHWCWHLDGCTCAWAARCARQAIHMSAPAYCCFCFRCDRQAEMSFIDVAPPGDASGERTQQIFRRLARLDQALHPQLPRHQNLEELRA